MVTESETALLAETEEGGCVADRVLLERYVVLGDRQAMDALLARHWPTALRVAQRYTGNQADAEDCVQEALLRCCLAAPQFRGQGTVRAWLLQAVVNACRMRFRAEDARDRRQQSAGETERLRRERAQDDPDQQELRAQVRSALAELPERYRLPLWLRYVEDLSLSEVAAALRRPEATIRSQVQRGLKQVAARLERRGTVVALALLGGQLGELAAETPTTLLPPAAPTLPEVSAAAAAGVAGAGAGFGAVATAAAAAALLLALALPRPPTPLLAPAGAAAAPATTAARPPNVPEAELLFDAARDPAALRRYAATLAVEAGLSTGHAHDPQRVELVALAAPTPRLGIVLDARWEPGATETLVITHGFADEPVLRVDCALRLPDYPGAGADLPLQLTALLRSERPDPAPRRILEVHPEVLRASGLLDGAWVAYRAELEHCQEDGAPATELRYYLGDALYLRSRIELRSPYLLPVSITDHRLEVADLRVSRARPRLDPL